MALRHGIQHEMGIQHCGAGAPYNQYTDLPNSKAGRACETGGAGAGRPKSLVRSEWCATAVGTSHRSKTRPPDRQLMRRDRRQKGAAERVRAGARRTFPK